jgi:hypothetical protein
MDTGVILLERIEALLSINNSLRGVGLSAETLIRKWVFRLYIAPGL